MPVLLLVTVSGGVFGLAKLHLAKPGVPPRKAVTLGDATHGKVLFSQTCAACHGQAGAGGGIGPKLAGLPLSLEAVQAQIDAGGGVMPAGIVKGTQEHDVLAYIATIVSAK